MLGDHTVTLFRPVGKKELDLVIAAGYRRFPARLPFQPIFYPVLDYEYAEQIARDWNTRDPNSGYAGYVTQFRVDAAYMSQFPVRTAGGAQHREYWIPAEKLDEFNGHIIGTIEVVREFHRDPGS